MHGLLLQRTGTLMLIPWLANQARGLPGEPSPRRRDHSLPTQLLLHVIARGYGNRQARSNSETVCTYCLSGTHRWPKDSSCACEEQGVCVPRCPSVPHIVIMYTQCLSHRHNHEMLVRPRSNVERCRCSMQRPVDGGQAHAWRRVQCEHPSLELASERQMSSTSSTHSARASPDASVESHRMPAAPQHLPLRLRTCARDASQSLCTARSCPLPGATAFESLADMCIERVMFAVDACGRRDL